MTPCCQSQCLCLRPISNWCYSCPTRASRTQSFTRCFRLTLYSLSIPAKRRMCCPWSLRSDSYYCLYVQGVNSLWRLKHTDTGTPWFISWIILLTVEDGQYDHDCLYQPSRSIVPHDNVEKGTLPFFDGDTLPSGNSLLAASHSALQVSLLWFLHLCWGFYNMYLSLAYWRSHACRKTPIVLHVFFLPCINRDAPRLDIFTHNLPLILL